MIYLDHNATTSLRREALDAMSVAHVNGRNPMSLHRPGRRARVGLDEAREALRRLCHAPKADVVFTSGGTEADHLAVRGLAQAQRDLNGADTVLVTSIEHPAVLEAVKALETDGFNIQVVLAEDGRVNPEAIQPLLGPHVALLTTMLAHNTSGIIQPVREIGELATRFGVPFHVDAVQAVGKIEVDFYSLGATSLALSAHKFGGPRGAGALIIQKCVRLSSLWSGGGQEEGKRSGSHASTLIAGMAAAADAVVLNEASQAKARDWLEAEVLKLGGIHVIGRGLLRLPNTLSVIIEGVVGRDFVVEMDKKGVAVSAGAACHSSGGGNSPAGQIRFSLGHEIKEKELEQALEATQQVVRMLRENI